jgi:LacI family transcriptional regulator
MGKKPLRGPVRQSDIARLVGISERAVGYALSADPALNAKVGDKTRARVRRIAEESGYRVHAFARALSGGKSRLIGVIANVSLRQAEVECQYHVARAIYARQYEILPFALWWDAEANFRRAVDAMRDARVEGVLVMTATSDRRDEPALRRLHDAGIPIVSIHACGLASVPWLDADRRQGTFGVARHLVEQGCRRLAFLLPWAKSGTSSGAFSIDERLKGFREALRSAGLPPRQAPIVFEASPDGDQAAGRIGMNRILALPNRPQAVVCANDDTALGARMACLEAGLRVPEDMALAGFDDTSVARCMSPALTSVAVPSQALAEGAMEWLFEMIRNKTLSNRKSLLLPCELRARESCGETMGLEKR